MPGRELVVLGTASQVPTRHRNHNGYLLRWDGSGVLFDPGEGTQRQMTMFGARVTEIRHICVTHFHGDHSLGLAGMLQRCSFDAVPEVTVHYPASGQMFFDRLRHASQYDERTLVQAVPIERAGVQLDDGPYRVIAHPLDHRVDTWGFRVEEPDGRTMLPDALAAAGIAGAAIAQLQHDGELRVGARTVRVEDVSVPRHGQVFAFVMDTRPCPGALELARGADLLVCESTFLESERELAAMYGHMTARDAAFLARDAGARRLVLTHFSQRHPETDEYLAEASAVHPDVIAAHDGMRVALPARVRDHL